MKSPVHAKKLALGVVVGGVVFIAATAPAATASTAPQVTADAAPVSTATPVFSLGELPGALGCLLSTGSSGFCVGIP